MNYKILFYKIIHDKIREKVGETYDELRSNIR